MKRIVFVLTFALGILLIGSLGLSGTARQPLLLPDDADHDGVPDAIDKCPTVNASFFDRNGDGCIDDGAGARHTEFWAKSQMPFTYYINAAGAPGITNGSDFTAVQSGINAWMAIPNIVFSVTYAGTSAQQVAAALDQLNLVTFKDSQWSTYNVSNLVLALGISTSFTVDTEYNGKLYRPGQIVDADLIFNPNRTFKTPTAGTSGYDIQSIVTHEAGHLFGISHSPVQTSTMFYVLPPGTNAASLSTEDREIFFKAYGDSTVLANANRIAGRVLDGKTNDPVPGAIVYAINAASGDTAAADYTLPDGRYTFAGLSNGSYYVAIHPIDESSEIGGLIPEYINALVDTTAVTNFPSEYYDASESSTDNPTAKLAVSVSGGTKATGIDIITNVDATPPEVVSITPVNSSSSASIDGVVKITFSERIDYTTVKGNFVLRDEASGASITGTASFLKDDSVIAFTPAKTFDFSTSYGLTLKTGLKDIAGNSLATQYTSSFTTQAMPPLAITSLAPSKGVVGSIVVINGAGFSSTPADNVVLFGNTPAQVTDVFRNRLLAKVPKGTTTGLVTVQVGEKTSNGLTFTVLSQEEVAKGFQTGIAELLATPQAIAVLPGGIWAYVATDAGVSVVVVDPGFAGYLSVTQITVSGGLDALSATPDGKKVYGVSRANGRLYAIDTDPSHGPLFNTIISERPLGVTPLGIVIDPSGSRAYVSADDGHLQVWDVRTGSATFEEQIGLITPPNMSIRGRMAIDPAGRYLLALSGTGKLYVYSIGPDTLYATASVLLDPRDVIVDPTGQHAYVADGTGNVSIVPLSGLFQKTYDISTGGSLRGMTITPGGSYLYACNRDLNLIDVIDINEQSSKARSVVATIDLEGNPVDIDLSPDGFYAFTAAQGTRQLVVTTIGLGPTLKSISRRAGPPGTKLVLAGSGFVTTLADIRVVFPNMAQGGLLPPLEIMPEYSSGTSLTVTVPVNAGSGPIKVVVTDHSTPDSIPQVSNSLYFEVINFLVTPGSLRRAAGSPTGIGVLPALAFSPTGDFLVVGGFAPYHVGLMGIFDTDPESPTFNQWINKVSVGAASIDYVTVTPDGERAYLASDTTGFAAIQVRNVNRHSGQFGKQVSVIDLSTRTPFPIEHLSVSPDGEILLASTSDTLYVINIVPGSTEENRVIGLVPNVDIRDVAFHPGGRYAYLANYGFGNIEVLNVDPMSPNRYHIVSTVNLSAQGLRDAYSLSFLPSGDYCIVLDLRHGEAIWEAMTIKTIDPANPILAEPITNLGCGTYQGKLGVIRVSPRGDRALAAVGRCGYVSLDVSTTPPPVVDRINDSTLVTTVDFDFTPDGSRIYVAGPAQDSLFIYDFSAASYMLMMSGNEQAGIAGEALSAPLRVFVGLPDSALVGVPGVPVTFTVTTGGGYFTDSHLATQVVATDAGGYAKIKWTLGPIVGVQTQRVRVESVGLSNSPRQFIADSYDSPDNLPLRLSQMIPTNGTVNVSVTSAVQATLTRAVNPHSLTSATYYVRKKTGTLAIPAIVGLSDGDRKVALIPQSAFEYGTGYVIQTTSGITDMSGGQLANPGQYEFTTAAKPPLVLAAVTPPAASVGASLVLSGSGFDAIASNDKILFNTMSVAPYEAGVDYMKVIVPLGAIPGTVRAVVGVDTSNAVPFVVLQPSYSPIDEVLATVNTSSTVKSVAVTPDGALAYSVSPDGDIVIPIDVDGQTTYPSISVGDDPMAIAIDSDGRYAYIANFKSGTVSVIVVDPDSIDTFNKVVATITVGTNPIDVAVSPDGDRVYVANAGSMNLSVIDGDNGSATCHQVLATVPANNTVKSVTVTPDGTRIYAGTDVGYVVIDAQTNAVTATVNTNNSIKSVTVTPDGAFLIALTTEGKVLVIDIMPGSSTVNKVLATISTTNTVKSVAVSPDGALLYLILDNNDKALVYSLTVIGSSATLEPGTPVPPPVVQLAPVDTIPTGHDPACIAFDPSGSGLALICNAGDKTVTFLNATGQPPGPIKAEVDIWPSTLLFQLPQWLLRWVMGRIELPAGYSPEEIDIKSVRLQNAIKPVPWLHWYEDKDHDGKRELVLFFDRVAFQRLLPQGEYVPVTITGTVRDRQFAGVDTIRTIRPCVIHPSGCMLTMGETTTIEWTSPAGYKVDSVSVDWTPNDGRTWSNIAHGIPDTHSYLWHVPMAPYDSCRVMVTLYKCREILGQGMSQDMFIISMPVAVTVQQFDGVVEDAAAVFRWRTALEQNVNGFNLLRSEAEAGAYGQVNARLIPSSGPSGGTYKFRDSTIALNRTYYYQLEEVSNRGSKVVFGPYALVARAPFELGQNSPNPFNPVTTIKFTVPEDCRTRLVVYDVSGRRVRTLVDEDLRANFYKVQWNGRNEQGRQVASGVYFYRLQAGRHVQSKKMLLMR